MNLRRSRREFIQSTAAFSGAAIGLQSLLSANDGGPRKRIAFLGTEVRTHSHAQHFLDRHAMGYTWGGKWQKPRFDIASVYIDQHPEGDLAPGRISKYGLKDFPSIEEALTLGTSKLAVDGVVIIAEHGKYPDNEKGQKRYPRYEWFKRVVKVFESSGRSVPVFNDKHLSTVWSECKEMVEDSKRLGFPFLAGSSLPVTWRMPSIDMPLDTPLQESVCVCYGGVDSYDIHGLETAQCMSERRKGGEVGVRSVQALRDDALWQTLAGDSYKDTRKLLVSALTRSHNLPVETGYPTAPIDWDWAVKTLAKSIGYIVEHRDGFRTTLLLAPIRDFNYAGLRSDNGEIISCQMYLPMPTHGSTTADFFNPLANHIETLVVEGKTPYPVERTLLTSGMVIAGVESLYQKGKTIETPELAVTYRAKPESAYWRV
ncbi:MAG: hypothetical protein MUD03_02680 [Pirellula sp.]|jgi:hypothetical protein|nr:hypothetical protein [Pirellula sp.]